MRDFRSGSSDEELELEGERKRSPGKVSLTSGLVARKADGAVGEGDVQGVGAMLERGGGGGAPLPETLRGSFEDALGVRLADVRVHTSGESAAAATSINARAFTVGQDIHFADGQYNPGSAGGKHLLAHEVAHTAQQQGGSAQVQTKLEVTKVGDTVEAEADRAADAMVTGQKATVSSAPIAAARAPAEEGPAPVGPADNGQDATELAGKVKVKAKVTRSAGKMEYDAKDYKELYTQVMARAQSSKCAGTCECGAANCNFKSFTPAGGTEEQATEMTIEIDVKVAVPTWKQRDSAPEEHRKKFDAWAASVAAHEEKHFNIYKTNYEGIGAHITGPTVALCNSQYDARVLEIEKLQDPIDEPANQPAPLDIPGGIEKVP